MHFISNNVFTIICSLILLSITSSVIHFEAYGDGLTMENLPPASVGNRQASLFIQVSPPILTSDTAQDTFLKLRLFDANNNQTIQSNSFFVKVTKDEQLLMRELFYTKSGVLTIKFKPINTPGKWQAYGDIEPTLGGWTATNDQVRVDAPVFLEGGLYHFEIKFIGIDAAKNIFKQGDEPTFNSYLSVGDVFKKSVTYQAKSYDTTIISYYDRIKDFKFDESKKLISFYMPFNWNVSRIEGQNIFVHEEIQIPKSFKDFADNTSFSAKVNGIPLVGRMLAVDPYSKEDELILHYLINKNDILEMSKKVPPTTKTMDFTLSPGNVDAQTSTEILTDFGGFRAELGWSPTDLKTNTKTDLKVIFFDAFSGKQVAGDVKYDLKILDKNGNPAFSKANLNAIGATDTQSINFANNGVYTLEIDIKSITITGKTDSSRLGIARGYVIIPSTITSSNPTDVIKIPDWVRNNAKWWSEGSIGDKDFASGIQYMIKQGIIIIPVSENGGSNQNIKIPDWVRNNAKWWSEGSIGDKDFASGIQYMIKQGIIIIPVSENGGSNQNIKIPDWVRNNAKWWSEGSIGDKDFASGIQYMIKMGIITV